MTLAVVRNIGSSVLRGDGDVEGFQQEIVDQFALAMASSGVGDSYVAANRRVLFEFIEFIGRPLWSATCADADRFLSHQRSVGRAASTRSQKAAMIAQFYEFVIARYQGDIHELTGWVVEQPIDEFNRPASVAVSRVRVPPSDAEIEELFSRWRAALPEARKYLPAARDYVAASLWRRLGLRINETVMLDIRDWRPDLGGCGKLHVRFGKGSGGRGPKQRLIPAINGADALLDWWLGDVRHQFGPDGPNPDAPMLPSERLAADGERCLRIGAEALRQGLTRRTAEWLPAWSGRLTPHVLRHYCASSFYAAGMDLKALQELLGHEWLSTTTRYVHVRSDYVEKAWADANRRLETRFEGA